MQNIIWRLANALLLVAIFTPYYADATDKKSAGGSVWKQWYLLSRGGEVSGVIQETLEYFKDNNEYRLQQLIIERNLGGPITTYVQSTVAKDQDLTPVAFYVKRRAGGSIDIAEGIRSGNELGIRIHVGTENKVPEILLQPLNQGLTLGAFASLRVHQLDHAAKKSSSAKAAKLEFPVLLEELEDGKIPPKTTLTAKPADASLTQVINGSKCRAFSVDYGGIAALWWVSDKGMLCRARVPSLESELEATTEEKAKAAL